MFAMFHLGRPDVLPLGDLGVRKGIMTLYGIQVRSSTPCSFRLKGHETGNCSARTAMSYAITCE